MKIDLQQLKDLCSERDMNLSVMLESAGVSRNAFYTLARHDSVLPGSIRAIAEYLQIPPSRFLVDEGSPTQHERALVEQIDEIALRNPDTDRDTIHQTLVLLQKEPVERLRRALQRAEATILSDMQITFLGELIREQVDFMITGLSAAILQGAPLITRDVELWFRDLSDPGISQALRRVFGSYIPPTGEEPPGFVGEAVKLFAIVTHMPGLGSFDEEYDRTVEVRFGEIGIWTLQLERIIVSREAIGQKEEYPVLPILKDVPAVIREIGQLE